MTAKNRGGRPRKYTAEQVQDAIDRVEARGDVANGAIVKEVLHEELGVSPGIDVGILDVEVQRICLARSEEKERRLVAKLPGSAKDAANGVGQDVTRAIVALLATQFDILGKESSQRVAERESDLSIFRNRVQCLDAEISAKNEVIADLEEAVHVLTEHGKGKDATIVDLQAQIAAKNHDDEIEIRLLAMMQDLMAKNTGKDADGKSEAAT